MINEPSASSVTIVVIEEAGITPYTFRERDSLRFGRRSSGSLPDVAVSSPFVSRDHGQFIRINASWFYCDKGSKNGTILRDRLLKGGMRGRLNPVLMNHGDVLIVSSGKSWDAPSCRILFLYGEEESSWSFLPADQKKITFGTSTHHDFQFTSRPFSGVVTLRKERGEWSLTSDYEEVSINGLPCSFSQSSSIPVRNMDCVTIGGSHFIVLENGLFCPQSTSFRVNLGQGRRFGW